MHALLFDKCLVFYDRWVVSVPSFPPTDPPEGDLKGYSMLTFQLTYVVDGFLRSLLFHPPLFLYIESEKNDIAVLYDVLLPFGTKQSLIFSLTQAAQADKIIIVKDFCADKAPFHIAVNPAGSFRGPSALGDGPGAEFRACRRIKGD
jgi:hypothetical protein